MYLCTFTSVAEKDTELLFLWSREKTCLVFFCCCCFFSIAPSSETGCEVQTCESGFVSARLSAARARQASGQGNISSTTLTPDNARCLHNERIQFLLAPVIHLRNNSGKKEEKHFLLHQEKALNASLTQTHLHLLYGQNSSEEPETLQKERCERRGYTFFFSNIS